MRSFSLDVTNGFEVYLILAHNGLRVGDVASCCPACAGARQYSLHAVSVSLVLISYSI